MANWNNGAPGYGYVGYATLGVNLNRQKNADLDVSSTYTSKEDACYYVTEGRYPVDGAGVTQDVKDMVKYPYLGQIIKIVNSESETVDFYFIKTAVWDDGLSSTNDVFNHYFEKFGSASITTDEKSISLQVFQQNLLTRMRFFPVIYSMQFGQELHGCLLRCLASLSPCMLLITLTVLLLLFRL